MKYLYFDGMQGLVRVKPIRKTTSMSGTDLYIVEAREDAACYHKGDIIESFANWLVNKSARRGYCLMCRQADVSRYF
jgi:hypothetical protein